MLARKTPLLYIYILKPLKGTTSYYEQNSFEKTFRIEYTWCFTHGLKFSFTSPIVPTSSAFSEIVVCTVLIPTPIIGLSTIPTCVLTSSGRQCHPFPLRTIVSEINPVWNCLKLYMYFNCFESWKLHIHVINLLR